MNWQSKDTTYMHVPTVYDVSKVKDVFHMHTLMEHYQIHLEI